MSDVQYSKNNIYEKAKKAFNSRKEKIEENNRQKQKEAQQNAESIASKIFDIFNISNNDTNEQNWVRQVVVEEWRKQKCLSCYVNFTYSKNCHFLAKETTNEDRGAYEAMQKFMSTMEEIDKIPYYKGIIQNTYSFINSIKLSEMYDILIKEEEEEVKLTVIIKGEQVPEES